MSYLKPRKGFTLIEIVIVLAIAALIMIIVFVAVQGTQRSRRNAQRQRALDSIAGQVETYASNNRGKYPSGSEWNGAGDNTFVKQYIAGRAEYIDPVSGEQYYFNDTSINFTQFDSDSAQCKAGFKGSPNENGAGAVVYAYDSITKKYRLRMCLENADYELKQ